MTSANIMNIGKAAGFEPDDYTNLAKLNEILANADDIMIRDAKDIMMFFAGFAKGMKESEREGV